MNRRYIFYRNNSFTRGGVQYNKTDDSSTDEEKDNYLKYTFGGIKIAPANCYYNNGDLSLASDWREHSFRTVNPGNNNGSFYLGSDFIGYTKNTWRIPDASDIYILLYSDREGSTLYYNDTVQKKNILYSFISYITDEPNGINNGLLLFPDNVEIYTDILFDDNILNIHLSSADIDLLINQGCAFIPTIGMALNNWTKYDNMYNGGYLLNDYSSLCLWWQEDSDFYNDVYINDITGDYEFAIRLINGDNNYIYCIDRTVLMGDSFTPKYSRYYTCNLLYSLFEYSNVSIYIDTYNTYKCGTTLNVRITINNKTYNYYGVLLYKESWDTISFISQDIEIDSYINNSYTTIYIYDYTLQVPDADTIEISFYSKLEYIGPDPEAPSK